MYKRQELEAERHFKMCVERQHEINRRVKMAVDLAMERQLESMAKPTVFDHVMSFLGVRKHRDGIDEPPSKRLKYSIR